MAFIGLGNMGLPMAKNLLAAGDTVRGFDVVPQIQDAAKAAGIEVAENTVDAMNGAAVVITMLPKGEHVKAVYFGDDGVLAHATPEQLLIDSSTIDIAT